MANDRIFIRCTACGKQILLTEHWPAAGDLGDLTPTPETLWWWLSEHLNHHERKFEMFLDGDPGLEFVTESTKDGRGA